MHNENTSLPEKLARLLGDSVTASLVAQGYHWNVKGINFSQFHDFFQDIYEDFNSAIDPLAENIKKLGAEAPYNINDLAALSDIQKLDTSVQGDENMVSSLLAVNLVLLNNTKDAFNLANECNEQGIADFLAGRIDMHQKWDWQLKATLDLSNRAVKVFEDKAMIPQIIAEFNSLDLREALLVSTALKSKSDTMEYLHAKTRLSALVAAGAVSSELADTVTSNSSIEPSNLLSDYEFSRDAFLQVLETQQYSSDLLKNPYDAEGTLSRMVARGDSKQQIKDYLESNSYFRGQRDFTTIAPEDLDLEEQIALFKYLELAQALEDLVDPEQAPDFAANAKNLVAPYDEDSEIAGMIDAGASSEEILTTLSANETWVEDSYDYATRLDVDRPSKDQKDKWRSFSSVLFAIKDLDSLQISN
jgi:starvation-inducible DNA-binding protein